MSTKLVPVFLTIGCLLYGAPAKAEQESGDSKPSATIAGPAISDVILQDSGVISGRIVDGNGNGQGAHPVTIRYGTYEIAQTTTARDGSFHIAGLRAGIHQVITPTSSRIFRFWTSAAAPPQARSRVLMTTDGRLIRGSQEPGSFLGSFLETTSVLSTVGPSVFLGSVAGVVAGVVAYDEGKDRANAAAQPQSP